MIPLETYSYWVALGSIFLQLVTAYLLFEYFFLTEKYLSPYVGRFALWIVCIVGTLSAALSLTYSEIYGFIPCGLCWIERGLLYSVTIITGIALWKSMRRKYTGAGDTSITDYGIGLSVVAVIVAFYHHYIQMGGREFVLCPTSGGDCARRLVFEFGYVTFPLMSLTVFAFFIACFLIYRRAHT